MRIFALLSALALSGCGLLRTSYEIRVATEQGEPIADAHIKYSWSEGGDPWTGKGVRRLSGTTTSKQDGLARFTGSSRVTFLSVKKPGFYSSRVALHPEDLRQKPFDIILRGILDPVPLRGKQAFVELHKNGGEIGYDLLKGDLVAPYGTGEIDDFKIRWKKPDRNQAQDRFDAYDFEAPHQGDGFVALHLPCNDGQGSQSEFHTLYQAPESGYVSGLRESARNTGKELRDMFVYYFRIRSQSSSGPIYGKIVSGPRHTFYNEGSAFKFVYMMNTTGSRNLEPDIERSVAPRLGHLEYALQNSTGLENR